MDNQGAQYEYTEETHRGVTTAQSKTKEFSKTIGASAGVELGPINASISAETNTAESSTTSIELTESTTITDKITVSGNTFVQCWQLVMTIQSNENGAAITQETEIFQNLSFKG